MFSRENGRRHIRGLKADEEREYAYDALGRLVSVDITGTRPAMQVSGEPVSMTGRQEKSYSYDKVGNRVSAEEGGICTEYAYNEMNQLASSVSGGIATEYAYDANGNQTSQASPEGRTASTFDTLGRLASTSVYGPADAAGARQLVSRTESAYNGNGQRIEKKVTGDGETESTSYFYQDGVASYTTDGTGARTSLSIMDPDEGSIMTERYAGGNGAFYLYTRDMRGSVKNMLDDEGGYVTGYSYDDFGATARFGDMGLYNEAAYTGGIYDESTSQYYLNARYYDPSDGRLLSLDTYRGEKNDPRTWNLYIYCADDPINNIDSSGHKILVKKFGNQAYRWDKESCYFLNGVVLSTFTHNNNYNISKTGLKERSIKTSMTVVGINGYALVQKQSKKSYCPNPGPYCKCGTSVGESIKGYSYYHFEVRILHLPVKKFIFDEFLTTIVTVMKYYKDSVKIYEHFTEKIEMQLK